jgi:hypothetical protein
VGRNILTGHREAVERLHAVVGAWMSHESASSRALASLKDRCERGTDLLLAFVHRTSNVDEFAFDAQRMHDFADDHAHALSLGHEPQSTNLLTVSLRTSFGDLSPECPNCDLHSQIAGAALGCFGPESFDSYGLLRSTWLDRLQRSSDETAAMLSDLCAQESAGLLRSKVRRG